MTAGRRFRLALACLGLVIAVGTAGYVVIEGMTLLDALFMTVTTVSTVGYREVQPLDAAGRVFTMVLIVFGVGSAFYLFTAMAEAIVEGAIGDSWGRARMQRRIDEIEGHVIVCGFGRFGRAVVEGLRTARVETVIVDSDPAVEAQLAASGALFVAGSALADDVLERAGVRRARAVVVATGSDPDNVFITLSVREKNPRLRIHARGETDAGLHRLRLAGADQAVSAYQMGGSRIASSIVRPSVVDFLEISTPGKGEHVDLEEVRLEEGGAVAGRTVSEVESANPRMRVVALKREGESIRLIPDADTKLAAGDYLVVIGDRAALDRLAQESSAARDRPA
ncbi:MAG TPA: potassium channel protein [Candidatus Binatia bacterium]|nr:potassium channel protein [Candidatus Binatia bacterium]